MPNAGVVSIVVSPSARRRNLLLCAFLRPSSVVQDWPDVGTNCRPSIQSGQVSGGSPEDGYCIPQAVQMKAAMDLPFPRRRVAYVPAKARALLYLGEFLIYFTLHRSFPMAGKIDWENQIGR